MYSQGREEAVILDELGGRAPARLLDIGAFHPTALSNTRALLERGWGGVLIEPSPWCAPALVDAYTVRGDVVVLQALVQPAATWSGRLVKFYDSGGDAVSTTDMRHVELWRDKGGIRYRPMWVAAISLADLFTQLPGPYELVSIDTERTSVALFDEICGFGLTALGVRVVCVEHDGAAEHVVAQARAVGYGRVLYNDPNNVIVAVNE